MRAGKRILSPLKEQCVFVTAELAIQFQTLYFNLNNWLWLLDILDSTDTLSDRPELTIL